MGVQSTLQARHCCLPPGCAGRPSCPCRVHNSCLSSCLDAHQLMACTRQRREEMPVGPGKARRARPAAHLCHAVHGGLYRAHALAAAHQQDRRLAHIHAQHPAAGTTQWGGLGWVVGGLTRTLGRTAQHNEARRDAPSAATTFTTSTLPVISSCVHKQAARQGPAAPAHLRSLALAGKERPKAGRMGRPYSRSWSRCSPRLSAWFRLASVAT